VSSLADRDTDIRPPLLAADSALYLDFDGTLAHLAPHPDRVTIQHRLPALLAALRERLQGAVAVVTGRRLATVDALIAPALLPGAGLHGAELRLGENGIVQLRHAESLPALARALHARFDADPRLVIEDKGAAVALHYRQAPERAAECITAMRELATAPDVEIIHGQQVVEARPHGVDKGEALRALAAQTPFAGRVPVFVGDDVTDEDGFRAAAALSGWGIKVGAGRTCAQHRLDSVDAVHLWLRASLQALEKRAGR
jgi:trehalose 6-phosphate phosphatase